MVRIDRGYFNGIIPRHNHYVLLSILLILQNHIKCAAHLSPSTYLRKVEELNGNNYEFPVIIKASMLDTYASAPDTILNDLDLLGTSMNNSTIDITAMIHNNEEYLEITQSTELFNIEIDDEETESLHQAAADASLKNDFTAFNGYSTISSKYPCLRDLSGVFATMNDLENTYPNLVQKIDIGDSYLKKYDMLVLKITNFNNTVDKSKMFVMCGIHAREYAPPELCTRFAEKLVNGYGVDADITTILDNTEIHILPQSNPDGREIAETKPKLYWRKNGRDTGECDKGNAGVDLNRNFPYKWGEPGASTNPCSDIYRGESAASEPETQAITSYLKEILPVNEASGMFFDVHAFGRLNMWPYSYKELKTKDDISFEQLHTKFKNFNGHKLSGPGQDGWLYVASGVTFDWVYSEFGTSAHGLEIGDTFYQSCDAFEDDIAPNNLSVLLYAASVAKAPHLTPMGPDVTQISLSSQVVPQNSPLCVSARISDEELGFSASAGHQNVVSADIFIDSYPTAETSDQIISMKGDFSSSSVSVYLEVPTTGLSIGQHLLHIRGTDESGYIGPVKSVFFTVCDPSDQGCSEAANVFNSCGPDVRS